MKSKLSGLLLIGSVFCITLGCYQIFIRYRPISNHLNNESIDNKSIFSLSIPSLSINLPVETVVIKDSSWPTSSTSLSYISSSAYPGSIGNTIIYGHNWPNLLGKLENAGYGQDLFINLPTGITKKYQISQISRISPENKQFLLPSTDSRLTLYTCTGILDRLRLVITALEI